MILVLLLIFQLDATGAGHITVTPHPSFEACIAKRKELGIGECMSAPEGEIDDTHPVAATLRHNRCEMVAANEHVAIWKCEGRRHE